MSTAERDVLRAERVSKTFPGPVRALAAVDLAVGAGETVALIGESGSGKTTLLRMFNRLESPTEGAIFVGGEVASAIDPVRLRRRTGYVPQDGGLLPHWTVARNVGLVPELLGWDVDRREQRCHELLELVGLKPGRFVGRYPHELSGGERQRVAFARAVAADPPVVLLDEPFGALDALTRAELQREFVDYRQRLAKTMLLVTHDLDEALRLGDRVGVMKEGRLRQIATARELLEDPADDYVRQLLARSGATLP